MIVSRGELIEIGDGFRIPDVLARSGATLVEVGTTNRTRLADYERAITDRDRRAPARAPVELPHGRLHGAAPRARPRASSPSGTGSRSSTTSARARSSTTRRRADRARQPSRPARTSSASPATSCSAGRRRGSSVGRADLIERLRRHPLQRALRADKLTLAALEGTLALYRAERRGDDSRCCGCSPSRPRPSAPGPSASPSSPAGRSRRPIARAGGGALPLTEIPSFACALPLELAEPLRRGEPGRGRHRPRRPRSCSTAARSTDAEVEEAAEAVAACR